MDKRIGGIKKRINIIYNFFNSNKISIINFKNKYSILNKNLNKLLCKFIYNKIIYINSNNHFIVKLNDKYGCLDHLGNWIFKPEYNHYLILNNDYILKKNKKNKYFLHSTKFYFDTYYDKYFKSMDILIIKKENKYGCIDQFGKLVIPIDYNKINIAYINGIRTLKGYNYD